MLISELRTNVPGEPGLDYPIHNIVQVSLKDQFANLIKMVAYDFKINPAEFCNKSYPLILDRITLEFLDPKAFK